jgi:hypothetical protein
MERIIIENYLMGIYDLLETKVKYKDEIVNLKTYTHDINLLYKCFTTMKTKMEKTNVI